MRRRAFIFVKPEYQIRIILPTVLSVVSAFVINYSLLWGLRRFASQSLLQFVGIEEVLYKRFMADSEVFMWILVWSSVAIVFLSILWSLWISLHFCGPLARLENNLKAVLSGEEETLRLKAREGDAFYDVLDLLDQYIKKIRS